MKNTAKTLIPVLLLAGVANAAPTNLALNKPAIASSVQDARQYQVAKAFDGKTTTRWSSVFSDPQWLYVDLGANYTVNGVKLTWETAYAKSFLIQASADAKIWSDIYSTTTSPGGVQNLTVTPTAARYIRLYSTKRATVWGTSLWEMEVYGEPIAPTPPPLTCATGTAYYVSTSGNNNNAGTIANPWRTVGKAAQAALKPCDTVYVRGGIYNETSVWFSRSGTATQPIRILAYPSEVPVMDGTGLNIPNGYAMIGITGNYVTVSGFELKNGSLGMDIGGANDTVSKMNIHHMGNTGIYARGDYVVIDGNRVSYTSMSQYYNPKTEAWGMGINATGNTAAIKHAILRNNTVFNVYGEGLSSTRADGTLIENNVVYDNWATNTYICESTNVIYRNNLVYGSSQPAIATRFARPVLLMFSDEAVSTVPASAKNTVINNQFMGGDIEAFRWTGAAGRGLVNVLIANNTLVNGSFYIGGANVVNQATKIQNNIVYRNDGGDVALIPNPTGLTFSSNLWSKTPPTTAKGTGDVIGNPQLALTGPTAPGALTKGYFAISSGSPAIGKGTPISHINEDYTIFSPSTGINIGAGAPITYAPK
jgi:parallel beta-helix repeat protein